MIELIIIGIVILHSSHSGWKTLSSNEHFERAMNSNPNSWRWFDQLLMKVKKVELSALLAFSYMISMGITYLLLSPTGLNLLTFAMIIIAMGNMGAIRQSPTFPLIILAITIHPIFIVPLFLVREMGGWTVGIYWLFNGITPYHILFGTIGLSLYLILRKKYPAKQTRHPTQAPLFPQIYMIKKIRKLKYTIILNMSATLTLILVYMTQSPLMYFVMIAPVFVFALFWETHQWFPIMIMELLI